MVKVFQIFNKKTGRWVKMKNFASGKTQIMNVKQKLPSKKFKGVKVRK